MNAQQQRDLALGNLKQTGIVWSRTMPKVRDYFALLQRLETSVAPGFQTQEYGAVSYDGRDFPLVRVMSGSWSAEKPTILISAGVHGSEPAGVEAAMICIRDILPEYAAHFNFAAYPCLNPSGYEIDSRWNFLEQDLNRNFGDQAKQDVAECRIFNSSLSSIVAVQPIDALIDLHENLRVGVLEMERQGALAGTKSNWGNLAPGYFIYECLFDKNLSIGAQIIRAVRDVMPICPQTQIAGDELKDGVSFWPQDVNSGSDYTNPTSTDSYLLSSGLVRHGFTFESPEVWIQEDGTVRDFSVAERAAAHVAGVSAALKAKLSL